MKLKKFAATMKKEEFTARPADPLPVPEPKPPEVSGIYEGLCIAQARNPQWVYVKLNNVEGRIPVVIPRRLSGKLEGKRIYVEAITDSTGTSYRYVQDPIRPNNGQ